MNSRHPGLDPGSRKGPIRGPFLLCTAVLLAGLLSSYTNAAGFDFELRAVLYASAWRLSGILPPEAAPVIELVSPAALQQMHGCSACKVRGLERGRRIYLDETLAADVHGAGILVHEFVHYLQESAWGPSSTCADWREREAQAYAAEIRFLVEQHADPHGAMNSAKSAAVALCKEPAIKQMRSS